MNLTIATTLTNIKLSDEFKGNARAFLSRMDTPIPDELTVHIHPQLESVIDKLAKKKIGTWEFVGTDMRHRDAHNKHFISAFDVIEKDQTLGSISTMYKYGRHGKSDVTVISSKNINKTRGDQNCIKTGNPALAIRTVLSYFKPETLKDQMDEVRRTSQMTFSRIQIRANNELEAVACQSVPRNVLAAYLVNNMADYAAFVQTHHPQAMTELESIEEKLRSVEIVKSLNKGGEQLTVWLKPSGEVVIGDTTDIVVYQADELPATVSRKIGMLKLVEDTQTIEGVGMRHNKDVFIIMKGE
jgi:hypothetical protein